jgi:hypothetical protein
MEERKKEKSRGFEAFGIPVGSTLVFKKDPSVTVKTLDDKNKVEYQGKPYSISTLAKQLVGSPVSGYLYFKYGGKIIKSLAGPEAGRASPQDVPEPSAAFGPSAESADAEEERDIDPLAEGWAVDSDESAGDEGGEE